MRTHALFAYNVFRTQYYINKEITNFASFRLNELSIDRVVQEPVEIDGI